MPAICALRYNKQLSEVYQRLVLGGKPKKVDLVAVMRKMLVLAIGILNNDVLYDENWVAKCQKQFALAS